MESYRVSRTDQFFIWWLVQDANEPGIAGTHNQLPLSNYKQT